MSISEAVKHARAAECIEAVLAKFLEGGDTWGTRTLKIEVAEGHGWETVRFECNDKIAHVTSAPGSLALKQAAKAMLSVAIRDNVNVALGELQGEVDF